MSQEEYRNTLVQAAQIGEELTLLLGEYGQDLFELYGELCTRIARYEHSC